MTLLLESRSAVLVEMRSMTQSSSPSISPPMSCLVLSGKPVKRVNANCPRSAIKFQMLSLVAVQLPFVTRSGSADGILLSSLGRSLCLKQEYQLFQLIVKHHILLRYHIRPVLDAFKAYVNWLNECLDGQ